jgi:uncharacterized membrane protein YdjX (TVP38/TMEM64 family)
MSRDGMTGERNRRSRIVRGTLLAALVAAILAVGRAYSGADLLPTLREWINGSGPLGPLVFVALYVLATNVGIPGTPLTLAAGALFGTTTGIVVAMISSTLSASTMFAISRYVAGDLFASSRASGALSRRIEHLLEKRGPWVVALSRLVPFPFLLLNYSFGLTPVRFRTYVVWSFVGMIPMNVLFITGGDVLARWATTGEIGWPLVTTLAVVACSALVLGLVARRFVGGSP